MGFKMSNLDEAAKSVGSRSKAFLSSKLNKVGATVEGYFLFQNVDDIEGEYYHKETAYTNDGDAFYPLVVCNSGTDKKKSCTFCDAGSKKQAGALVQVYVPKDDETYVWERNAIALGELLEWFDRIPEGSSIMQQKFTIKCTQSSPRTYSVMPYKTTDKEIDEAVQTAYDNKHENTNLYHYLTNEQMKAFFDNGNKFEYREAKSDKPDVSAVDEDEDEMPL